MNAMTNVLAGPAPARAICVNDEMRGIVASVKQVDAWVRTAKAADRMVYATRSYLPKDSAGAARMRALSDKGLVMLVRKRSDLLAGEWNYIAVRTGKPIMTALEPAPRASEPRAIDHEAVAMNKLLPVLRRSAQYGRPCPTDAMLSKRSGLSPASVQATMDALARCNVIRIEKAKAPTMRVVVIVDTGFKTGLVR